MKRDRDIRRGLLLVVVTTVASVAVGVLTNLVTGSEGRLWPAFVVAAVVFVACNAVLWRRDQRRGRYEGFAHRFDRDRTRALSRVRTEVQRTLAEAYAGVPRLEVGFAEADGSPLGTGVSLADRFEESLLLLGAAGSGKTTVLHELAEVLLDRADADPDHPVPVPVSLSLWQQQEQARRFRVWRARSRPRRRDFTEWMLEQLRVRYEIPERVGRAWLSQRLMVLLLDGLDEVIATERSTVTESIASLLSSEGAQPATVVTCRSDEYVALPEDIGVDRVMSIRPLSRTQIQDYLVASEPDTAVLRSALAEQEDLWDVIATPLWLRVAATAFRGVPDGLPSDQVRQLLLDGYLAELLATRPAAHRERNFRALVTLARIVTDRTQAPGADTGLLAFQPPTTAGVNRYLLPTSLCSLSAVAVVFPLAHRFGLVAGLAAGLTCGLFALLATGSRFTLVSPDVVPAPRVTRRRVTGVGIAVITGVLGGTVAVWASGPAANFYEGLPASVVYYLVVLGLLAVKAWRLAFAVGAGAMYTVLTLGKVDLAWAAPLAAGTCAGTVAFLFLMVLTGGSLPDDFPESEHPFRRARRRLLPEWVLWTFAAVAVAAPTRGGRFWEPLIGTAAGLVTGPALGMILTAILWVPVTFLRHWLHVWSGHFPPRPNDFLREAVRHGLLVRSRKRHWLLATYKFSHAVFLSHLSDLDPLTCLPPSTVAERRAREDRRCEAFSRVADELSDVIASSEDLLADMDSGDRNLWLPDGDSASAAAKLLLERAKRDPDAPVPVVLSLESRGHRRHAHPVLRWDSRIRWVLVKADNRYGIDPGDLWRWLLDGKAALVLTDAGRRTTVELLRRIRASFPNSLLVATLNPAQIKRMNQLTPASAT